MLTVRSYRITVIVLFAFVLLGIGILMLSPFKAEVCENAAEAQQHNCSAYNIVLVAAWKIREAFSDGTFVTNFITAISTFIIALFTGTLWWSTRGLLRVTNEALHFTNMEFTSTHRPALRLKHIWLATPDGTQFFGHIQAGTPITVSLDIVNIGNAAATLAFANFVTVIIAEDERLPQRPPYNEPGITQFALGNSRLEIGITSTHAVSDRRVLTTEEIARIRHGEVRLYFIGTVAYLDDVRRPRQIAFCRYLKFDRRPARPTDTGRFEKIEDPDYEYQD
jgi:hypothetical protein